MVNPFKDVNWQPDVAARRAFARSLMIGFPIVALVLVAAGWFRTGEWPLALAAAVGGGGAAAGAVFYLLPGLARPFYVVWYGVACVMGLIVGNLFLMTVFYVIVTGTGLALRMLGRRLLETRIDRSRASYWKEAGPPPPAERYLRQF